MQAATSVCGGAILPALPALLELHPEIVVDLSLTNQRADIVAENVCVAVCRREAPPLRWR